MAKQVLPGNGPTDVIQVFTPSSIESIGAGGSLDTTSAVAIRIPVDTDYQINGAGTIATMPSGATGVAKGVDSIKFVTAVVVEVM
jgi:hypothetical protein